MFISIFRAKSNRSSSVDFLLVGVRLITPGFHSISNSRMEMEVISCNTEFRITLIIRFSILDNALLVF